MEAIKLLIIEDEVSATQVYEDVILQHNRKADHKFSYTICKTLKEGEIALESGYFDAAIIDLKLSNSDILEGRSLVTAIYQKRRIPIIIYSGSIAQIDDIEENALLKKRSRTQPLSDILGEIISIYNTGITTFLKPYGKVDQALTKIFWDHLSNDLNVWVNHTNPDTLLRYILSHFQELLEVNPDGDFQEYHPFEVYIKPPLKKNLHTGDLVVHKKQFFVVLSPACDIVVQRYIEEKNKKIPIRKAENLILVKAVEFDYLKLCIGKGGLDKGKIQNYVNNVNFRFHYLPPYKSNNGFLLDFQAILSIPFPKKIERVATISRPFIKDIISRFSNYYSRQGQPTFNQTNIINDLFNKSKK